MHFQVKMSENGKKKTFRDKLTTNKVTLMFLDVNVLKECCQLHFWTLSTNKQRAV